MGRHPSLFYAENYSERPRSSLTSVHPQTIAAGWRLAAKLAKAELEKGRDARNK